MEVVFMDDSAEIAVVELLPLPSAGDILTDEEKNDSNIAIVDTVPNDVACEIEDNTNDANECEAAQRKQVPLSAKKLSKDPRA
ncbi:hypothetical protein MRX96_049018 [Rhipicephalus microplus]